MPAIERISNIRQTASAQPTQADSSSNKDIPTNQLPDKCSINTTTINSLESLPNIVFTTTTSLSIEEMRLVLFNPNLKKQKHEMIRRGLTYDEAKLCWELKKNGEIERFPDGFWKNKSTAQLFFYAGLDSLKGFTDARIKNDIKTMADIYRKEVLKYTATSHKTNGQTAFYYEILGLRSFMTGKISYLKKKVVLQKLSNISCPN